MVIGMKSKEYIKSVILILLVMMSVVLTYMVWNFTPDLTNIDSAESKKSDVKSIGKPLASHIDNVIAPYQIVEVKDDKVKGMARFSGAIVASVRSFKEP